MARQLWLDRLSVPLRTALNVLAQNDVRVQQSLEAFERIRTEYSTCGGGYLLAMCERSERGEVERLRTLLKTMRDESIRTAELASEILSEL